MSARVSLIKCGSYEPESVLKGVRQAVELLGGIQVFIKPHSKVLVKPNLLMSKGPECAITTHPEVVRAVIRLLKEINCRVVVGDGPSALAQYIDNIDAVYAATGIKEICRQEDVPLVNFDKRRMRDKFPLASALDECDHLVSLPKFKTHVLTLMTGAIKNLFGLVSGTYKIELHKNYFASPEFAGILVDIYQEAKPSFTLIDGILAMEGEGPGTGGTPRQLGLLLAGSDCVALDAVMAGIMGIDPLRVLTTREAAARNLGEAALERIKIEGEQIEQLKLRPFILPKNAAKGKELPPAVQKLFKSLVRYYPYSLSLKCTGCGNCAKICPHQCISFKNNKMKINYKKCIACFCCQEACPSAAMEVKKSLLARCVGL